MKRFLKILYYTLLVVLFFWAWNEGNFFGAIFFIACFHGLFTIAIVWGWKILTHDYSDFHL